MVVAETRRPPVFQQTRREAMTIVASFEIAVVHQDFECIRNTARCIRQPLWRTAVRGNAVRLA